MRIEFTRTVKHDGRVYTKGDVITAQDGLGPYFCQCGWARDLSSDVHVVPSTAPVELKVHSTKHANKAKEPR